MTSGSEVTPTTLRSDPDIVVPNDRMRPIDRRLRWFLLVLGLILMVSGLRAAHLEFPLERDEGEFGYIAQEILRGFPMYESAYTQKLPGTYWIYALILSIGGPSIAAIHLGLLLTNAVIMGLLFLILQKTHGGLAGCIAAITFGVMAMSPVVLGFAAHATFFVTLFAVGGLYVLLCARERDRAWLYLVSGLCFGMAFLMKQSGIVFAPFALGLLTIDHLTGNPRRRPGSAARELALAAGAVIPFLLTAAYFLAVGTFSRFWFWTLQFPRDFAAEVSAAAAGKMLVVKTSWIASASGYGVLWLLALAGIVVTWRDSALGRSRYVYAAFGAACLLSVLPGFYFTQHYYVPVLAAVALLVGALGAWTPGHRSRRGLAAAVGVWTLVGTGLIGGMVRHKEYYFAHIPDAAISRAIYVGNPFSESIAIGDYLRGHTSPEDRVAILGSETQILFYAQRRSASRFVNTYFLTANHQRNRAMQREMIRDIEATRPKYIVFVRVGASWSPHPNSPRDILEWFETYAREHYEIEGILDLDRGGGVPIWGPTARSWPRPPHGIEVLRRRD